MKNTLKTDLIAVRPKYLRLSPLPPCHVIDKIQEELSKKHEVRGNTLGNHATLKIAESEMHFWSPEFDIDVVKRGKGSKIIGRMGPNQKVWAGFIFLATLATILFFLGLLMWIYQWVFSMQTPLTWSIPIGLLIAGFALLLAKFGQYKGLNQMLKLWQFFEEAIDAREKKQKDLLDELFPDEEILI